MRTPDVIRTQRQRLRLTQADLAREIGVDTRQINRYETGQTEPTLAVARRLAEKLRISMDELAGETAPLNGVWFSAWHNLGPDADIQTGTVEATQQGRNLSVQPLRTPSSTSSETALVWNAEFLVDGDSLLGGYKIEDSHRVEGGFLNLTRLDQTVEGTWSRISRRSPRRGKLCLARDLNVALRRLDQLVEEVPSE